MTHKADFTFFDSKRPWSTRKDLVLEYYLKPYLPKVATQKRPVLLVDGFAGPGRFRDGSEGSPLILCKAAETARQAGLQVPVRVLCIEQDAALCKELRQQTAQYRLVSVEQNSFQSVLPTLEASAKTDTVFLYLDPFTVSGLAWKELDRVFHCVGAGSSVEVLLNFSGVAITRIGCALFSATDVASAEEAGTALLEHQSTVASDLDAVLGGDWWQPIIKADCSFADKVRRVTAGYCNKLRTRFAEVCWHDIKEHSSHVVPKYTLVFGSRHPDALELMNDAAVKSRGVLAEEELPRESLLFEARSEDLVPDVGKLPELVLATVKGRVTRDKAVNQVIRQDFGRFTGSQIRKVIGALVDSGKMANETGKARMNDSVVVWVKPSK